MGTFGDLLEKRKDTIVGRWVDAVLSAYPADSAALFQAQQDPFANPLGHTVREGTRGIFQVILDGMDPEELRTQLDPIVRIRAVQQLTPTEALSFVFSLRSIVRDVIPEADSTPQFRSDLLGLDQKIDQVALAAFELYARRREEVGELRIREVKRQVAWVMGKINKESAGPEVEAPQGVATAGNALPGEGPEIEAPVADAPTIESPSDAPPQDLLEDSL